MTVSMVNPKKPYIILNYCMKIHSMRLQLIWPVTLTATYNLWVYGGKKGEKGGKGGKRGRRFV
jgi:hypothetical protein